MVLFNLVVSSPQQQNNRGYLPSLCILSLCFLNTGKTFFFRVQSTMYCSFHPGLYRSRTWWIVFLIFFSVSHIPAFFSPSLYALYCKPLLNPLSSMLLCSESSSQNLLHHNPQILLAVLFLVTYSLIYVYKM